MVPIPLGRWRRRSGSSSGTAERMKSNQIKALRGKLAARYPGEPTREFQPLTDRIRRALSWMEKACLSKQDSPIRFVELWIALNAL